MVCSRMHITVGGVDYYQRCLCPSMRPGDVSCVQGCKGSKWEGVVPCPIAPPAPEPAPEPVPEPAPQPEPEPITVADALSLSLTQLPGNQQQLLQSCALSTRDWRVTARPAKPRPC